MITNGLSIAKNGPMISVYDAPCPVIIYHKKSGIISVLNEAAIQLLGYTESDQISIKDLRPSGNQVPTAIKKIVGKVVIHRARNGHDYFLEVKSKDFTKNGESFCMEWLYDKTPNFHTHSFNYHFQQGVAEAFIVSRTDKEGKINSVNENFIRISGYKVDELIGNTFKVVDSGSHTRQFWARMWKTITSGKTWRGEIRNVNRDGSYFWLDTFIVPIIDEHGKMLEYLSISSDITARKEAEDALENNLQTSRETLIFGKMGSATVDPRIHTISLSRELLLLLNEPEVELTLPVTAFVNKYFPIESREPFSKILNVDQAKRKPGHVHVSELKMVTSIGITISVDCKCTVRDNKLFLIFHDVSEKVHTQNVLIEKANTIHTLLESITDGFFAVDRELRFTMVNKVFASYTGMTPEFMLDKKMLTLFPFMEGTSLFLKYQEAILTQKSFSIEHTSQAEPVTHFRINGYPNPEGLFIYYQDITPAKSAEQKIKETNQLFYRLSENVPGMIFNFYLDENEMPVFPYASSGAEILFGCEAQELMKDASVLFSKVYPEDLPSLTSSIRYAFRNCLPWTHEFRVVGIDDTIRWIHGASNPYSETKGGHCWYGFMHDISERKAALLQIAESETRNRLIIENSGEGILFSGLGGKIFSANPEACRIFQMTEHEIREAGIIGLVDLSDFRISAFLKKREIRGSNKAEIRMKRKNGDVFSAEITSRVFVNPSGQLNTTTIIHDINDRKLVDEVRDELLERFEKIASHVPGFIFQYRLRADGSSHFPYVSEGIKDTYGYYPHEVLDDASMVFTAIHPEDLSKVSESIVQSAETLKEWRCEYRVCLPGKEIMWLEGYSSPQKFDDGSIIWSGYITNITSRKKAELLLLESHTRYENMIANLPGFVYRVKNTEKHPAEFLSQQVEVITGYKVSELIKEQVVSYDQLIHPDDGKRVWDLVQESIRKGDNYEFEYRIITRDGSERWLWEKGKGISGESGQLKYLEGFVTDITEKKKGEEELAHSRKQLVGSLAKINSIIHSMQSGILVEDAERRITFVNDNFLNIFQIPLEEEKMIGMDCRAAVELSKLLFREPEKFIPSIEHLVETRVEEIGTELELIDGRVFERDYVPMDDGSGSHLWIYRDVTLRKATDRALEQSEALFRLLYNHTPAMMHTINEDGILLQVNDYWLQKMEYSSPREVVGKPLSQFLTDYTREKNIETFSEGYFTEHNFRNIESQFVTRSGRVLDTLVSATFQYDIESGKKKSLAVITDITENRRLQREVEKLAAIARYTDNAVVFTDVKGHITWVNDGFERITEYAREEVLGKKPGNFLQGHETDPKTIRIMRQALKNNSGFNVEIINYSKSGRKYWLDIEVMPLKDESGTLTGFMAIQADITDLKKAMEDMQKSEQALQTFMDYAPMVAFIKQADGKYSFFNKAYKDFMSGKKLAPGLSDYDIFEKDFADQCLSRDRKVLDTGIVLNFDHQVGDRSFLEMKFPLKDPKGNIFALGGISLDITEKLNAQQLIQQNEERLRSITDHLSDGIIYQYLADEEGKVISFPYMSNQSIEIFEVPADEIIKNPALAFSMVHEEDLAEMMRRADISFRELTAFDFEYRIVTPSGKLKWVHTRSKPRRLRDGKTIYDGLTINVTAQKKLELAVLANEAKLQSIFNTMISGVVVVDVNGEITYANHSAKEILSLKSQDIEHRYYSSEDWKQIDEHGDNMKPESLPLSIALFEQKSVLNLEHGLQGSNNKVKWLNVNAAPLFDKRGNLTGAVASFLDVTERKNSQRELEKVYNELNAILNASTDASFFLDENYCIRIFNKTGEENIRLLTGKQVKIGDNMLDYASPPTIEDFKRNFKTAYSGTPVTVERDIHFKPGNPIWTQVRYLPVYDKNNQVIGVSFNATDITQRKLAEQQLFQSQQYFESLVNSQSNFLIRIDVSGRFTFANKQFCEKFGFIAADLIGTDSLQVIHQDDQDIFVSAIHNCCEKPGQVIPVILRSKKSTKKQIYWTEWELVALQNELGEVTGIQAVGLDSTDRILSQLELQKASTRLMLATKASNLGVWEWNMETGEVVWNDIMFQLVGIDRSAKVTLSVFRNIVHREDLFSLIGQLKCLTPVQNNMNTTLRIKRMNDLSLRYIRFFCVGDFNREGKLSKLIGVNYDITEQEISNKLIRESEERFRTMADTAPVFIWLADEINRVTFFSKGWYDFTGGTEENELGKGWQTGIHPDDVEYAVKMCQAIFEQRGNLNVEYRLRRKDGVYRWILDTGTPRYLENGQFIGYIGSCFDITERKEAEAALAEKTFFLEAILSTIDVGIVACDAKANLTLFNKATENFHGLSATAINVYQWPSYYDLFHSDGITPLKPEEVPLFRALRDGSVTDAEFVIAPKVGKVRQILSNGRHLKDAEGNITGAVVAMQDITARKQAVALLERALKEKELLIKEIHHRIKNNLQLISSILYIKMLNLNNSEIKDFLHETRQKIKSIALIHERLLQTGSVNEIDIGDYLAKLISDLERSNISEGLTVDFETEIVSQMMGLDTAIYCGLIINELVTNSVKHAFHGRNQGKIRIKLRREDNDRYHLVVGDNGSSLPPEFEPGKSSSFGMQFLDIFIKQINGQIEIDRTKGTEYRINFKLA